MKKYYKFQDKSFVPSTEEDFVWLEVISPNQKEIRGLIKKYNIPRDYILDVSDPYEVARFEGLDDERPKLFILNYPVKISRLKYVTRPLSIITVDHLIITVRYENSQVFTELKEKGFRKISKVENTDNFILELAWLIARSYIEYVRSLNRKILKLEDRIKASSNSDFLYEMIDIQRSLTNFQMATRENGPVMERIFDLESIDKEATKGDLLHDLQVENKQARIMIEKANAILDKLTDLYSNVINNNLNEVMKILTSITIILTIPTIIGGLWGMNVAVPLGDNPHAFSYLNLASIVLSIIVLFFLKKKHYL